MPGSREQDGGLWWSLNLTTGTSSRVDCAGYGAPMFITGELICAEVVFFSTKLNEWIVLVNEHTTRAMPAGMREVASSELDHYAKAALGLP